MKKTKLFFFITGFLTLTFFSSFSQINESFEGTFPPPGWTLKGGNLQNGAGWDKGISTQYFSCHHSGLAGAVSESYIYPDEVTPDNWLITPSIYVVNNDSIVFWVKPSSTQYPAEHFELRISDTGTDTADFNSCLYSVTFTATDNNQWNKKAFSLSAWQGKTIFVAFIHNKCYGQNMLMIDDVLTVPGSSSSQTNENTEIPLVNYSITDGLLTLSSKNIIQKTEIYSITGSKQIEKVSVVETESIDISELKNGIYLITCIVDGKAIKHKILINN